MLIEVQLWRTLGREHTCARWTSRFFPTSRWQVLKRSWSSNWLLLCTKDKGFIKIHWNFLINLVYSQRQTDRQTDRQWWTVTRESLFVDIITLVQSVDNRGSVGLIFRIATNLFYHIKSRRHPFTPYISTRRLHTIHHSTIHPPTPPYH